VIYETYITSLEGERVEYGWTFKRAPGVDDVMLNLPLGVISDAGERTDTLIEAAWDAWEWMPKAICERFEDVFRQALPKFVRGYITCALWSSNDNADPETGGEPMDANYDADDMTPECRVKMEEDCADFMRANWADLALYTEQYAPAGEFDVWDCAGHDFWLTRNGHGAGFWDRGLGDLGARLTTASKPYGEVYLSLGWDHGARVIEHG
jgi:hypothetical protein